MKKIFLILLAWLLMIPSLSALDVDQAELKQGNREVQFLNYPGKLPVYTAETFKSVGRKLAADLKMGKEEGRYAYAFYALRAIDPSVKGKLDADIIIMSRHATKIRHIDTLRLIVVGYLEEMYGYNSNQAATLAFFVTVYNAVYRGDMEYLGSKYKSLVMSHLTPENAGIDTNYEKWPGTTRLIIPLTDGAVSGDLGALDTTELSNEDVTDNLQETEDKSIEERKDLVELKEEEVIQDKGELEKEKETLTEKEQDLEKDKEDLEKDKEDLAVQEEELAKEKETLDEITDPEEKAAKETEIAEKEAEIEQTKEDIAEKETAVTEKEKEITEDTTRIEEKENTIAEKEKEIASDKEEIARDERIEEIAKDPETVAEELADKENRLEKAEDAIKNAEVDEKTVAGKFYYLKVDNYLNEGHYQSTMYLIDAASGNVLKKAPVSNISSKWYQANGNGVYVVTNKGSSDPDSYLSVLDLDTLETKAESADPIYYNSFVEIKSDGIYAVSLVGNNYYLGKYDQDLKQVAVSREKIDPNSFITFFSNRIYVNAFSGSGNNRILALDASDLSLIETIMPE